MYGSILQNFKDIIVTKLFTRVHSGLLGHLSTEVVVLVQGRQSVAPLLSW